MVQAPIGYRLRAARKEKKLTQAAVARDVGISASYLNLIEANKREIGGALLNRIARLLELNADDLTGRTERRMIADLSEAAAEPLVQHLDLPVSEAEEIVGRYPAWARALLAYQRNAREQTALSSALADRLNQDPVLGESVHQLLTHATAIRSSSEILDDLPSGDEERRARFREIISLEAKRMSSAAEALRDLFDQSRPAHRALTPADEVDDFLVENDNWFPALEAAADALRQQVEALGGMDEGHLERLVRNELTTGVSRRSLTTASGARYRNDMVYDEDGGIVFLSNAAPTTRRFQLARHIAEHLAGDALDAALDSPLLTSEAARERARHAMASYVAAAMLMPYGAFLEAAEAHRYDITVLCQTFDASVEQVCHRLTSLRDPARRGVPFAFLRSDPAGHVTKRFPLPRLPLLRHGHACPLWAAFTAFQTPGRLVRQVAAFPDGSRYLMIAQAVARPSATYDERPFVHTVTLICDMLHADRTVYGRGMTGPAGQPATPVGPSCRLCARRDCRFRGEEAMLDLQTAAA